MNTMPLVSILTAIPIVGALVVLLAGPRVAKQVALGREFTRVSGLAGADVVDGFLGGTVRNMGGHGDEVFHVSAS